MENKDETYRLMISQLHYDGHSHLAGNLAKERGISIQPTSSNELHELVKSNKQSMEYSILEQSISEKSAYGDQSYDTKSPDAKRQRLETTDNKMDLMEAKEEEDQWKLAFDYKFKKEGTKDIEDAKLKPSLANDSFYREMTPIRRSSIISASNTICKLLSLAKGDILENAYKLVGIQPRGLAQSPETLTLLAQKIAILLATRLLLVTGVKDIPKKNRPMSDYVPKFYKRFDEADAFEDKVDYFVLDFVEDICVDRASKKGKTSYSRVTSARFFGKSDASFEWSIKSIESGPRLLSLILEIYKAKEKHKFVNDTKYKIGLFNDGERGKAEKLFITNKLYELFDESPDSLKLTSEMKSYAIGNFEFCDDKGCLIQALRSDIVLSLDNRLALTSSSIDSKPQFVVLGEAKGFAQTIAGPIINRYPKALIISLGGQPSIALRTFLHGLSVRFRDLKFFSFTDLNEGGYSIHYSLKYGSRHKTRSAMRSATAKFALGSNLIRMGLTAPQIKLAKKVALMNKKVKGGKEEQVAKAIDSLISDYFEKGEYELVEELKVLKKEQYYVQAESDGEFSIMLIVNYLIENL